MSQREFFMGGKDFLKIDCIKIKQPIGEFYVGAIKSSDLIDITYSDVRRMEGERGFESYLGIQRPLNLKRAKEIAEYTNTVDASFPTAVILSVPARCAEFDGKNKELILRPYGDDGDGLVESVRFNEIAKVIDGQHRIAGLEGYKGDEFWVNVSIFVDIEVSAEANIFSTVNLAQTKVTKSLAYDLYDLATKRSPQKLCHDIAVTLGSDPDSPFKDGIKRLGSAEPHNLPGSITQAAFVESLMRYMSVEPMKDRDMYMRGMALPIYPERIESKLIFRKYLVKEKDMELTALVWNYFDAVRERWPDAWAARNSGAMLNKTNGFMALMRFLKDCYLDVDKELPSKGDFLSILRRIDMSDDEFTVDNFKPGSSGESALYQQFKERSGL